MSANEFLGLVCQALFILLSLLTAVDYVRHPNNVRRHIALTFASVGVPMLVQAVLGALQIESPLGGIAGGLALALQPYLLIGLTGYFQSISPLIRRASLVTMLFGVAASLLSPLMAETLRTVLTLLLVVSFIVMNAVVMYLFVHGAATMSGIVRQRLRLAAFGSGLLALAFLVAASVLFLPSMGSMLTSLALLVFACSGLAYYAGFATPGWLRRTWQVSELRVFLQTMTGKPMYERLSLNIGVGQLCQSAMDALGGMASGVVWRDADGRRHTHHVGLADGQLDSPVGSAVDGIFQRSFHTQKPESVCFPGEANEADRALLLSVGAESVHSCPILTSDGVWGVVAVFQRAGALFPDDDLALLELLTQQSAVFLENSVLVEEMRSHTRKMESRVDVQSRELRMSEERYRRIVETAQEGIWLTRDDHTTIFVNQKMADMLATTIDDLMAASADEFVDDDAQTLVDEIRQRRREGITEQYELKFRRRDDGELWALVSEAPLSDEFGASIGSLAMVADITELKDAEARLLRMNAELEQRVESRTTELSTVNRELEAFAYSVSHDLRAPLRGIDGFSQALLEDYSEQLDEDGRGLLNRVRAAAQRMAALIDDLLNLSRITRSEMLMERVDLTAMAKSIAADLQQQSPEREVEVAVEPDMMVIGDTRLLRVALNNLLSNAWKFTRKTLPARIEVRRMPEHGDDVFAVRDNGAGFEMAYVDKLFGAFQRLHSASEYEGTGIGLATVQRVIHRHGGRIWAEGDVGRGATFSFTLKTAQSETLEIHHDNNFAR